MRADVSNRRRTAPEIYNGSKNQHIRNGVGILPDGKLLFAISKETINFYDFATFFKQKGCKSALYLDGFVSRCYLPSKNWKQLDGNFGVIIAVTERQK
ncbi:MAG: phosphodiester glycosidase family protein [Flavobacteriales bacterium]|nr:phosphodiester glycosidase family protein [Flavobacteriales bacterium]